MEKLDNFIKVGICEHFEISDATYDLGISTVKEYIELMEYWEHHKGFDLSLPVCYEMWCTFTSQVLDCNSCNPLAQKDKLWKDFLDFGQEWINDVKEDIYG